MVQIRLGVQYLGGSSAILLSVLWLKTVRLVKLGGKGLREGYERASVPF